MQDQTEAGVYRRRVWMGLGLAGTMVFLVVGVGMGTVRSFEAASQRVLHTQQVTHGVEILLSAAKDIEIATRGYLMTGSEPFLEPYASGVETLKEQLPILRGLIEDNPLQLRRLGELESLLAERLETSQQEVEARRARGLGATGQREAALEGRRSMDEIRQLGSELQETEKRLLVERLETAQRQGRRAVLWVSLGLGMNLVLGWGIYWLSRRELRQREANQQRLQEAGARIEDLYDRAPCGYHSVDGQGVFVAINATELAWLGYERSEVIGRKRFADILTEASRQRFAAEFEPFKQRGWVRDLEFDLVRKDGSVFPALLNATAIVDADGRFVSSRSTVLDMTERRRAEHLVQQARAHAESIVDTVREPLVILRADLRVQSANRSYYQTFGTTPEETEGRLFRELGNGQWNEPTLLSALEEILPQHTRFEDFELTVDAPGLGSRVMRLNARRLFRPGNNTAFILLAIEDITEWHRREQIRQHFRALFESLPGLYLVLTPDWKVAAISETYLRAIRRTRAECIDQEIFAVLPLAPGEPSADFERELRASVQRVLHQREADTLGLQRLCLQPAGPAGGSEERHWNLVHSPVFTIGQNVEFVIQHVEDVTDFVRHEEAERMGLPPPAAEAGLTARLERMEAEVFLRAREVEAANRQLRAANEELESFSYSVSHDLRAPLRHIGGFADMLRKHAGTTLDEKGRRYLQTIADSARRMGGLIDDLLVFSRVGRAELHRVRFSLSQLVEEVVAGLQSELGGRMVEWRLAELPEVEADAGLIRQVWANLLGNAVKYTRHRERAVIEVGRLDTGPLEVGVFVRDNGAGFDMNYAGKLFGVFQRLHSAAEFEGTGVGLANVRRIVQRHGGRVWAEGSVDAGATFYFTLPVPVPGDRRNSSYETTKEHLVGRGQSS